MSKAKQLSSGGEAREVNRRAIGLTDHTGRFTVEGSIKPANDRQSFPKSRVRMESVPLRVHSARWASAPVPLGISMRISVKS